MDTFESDIGRDFATVVVSVPIGVVDQMRTFFMQNYCSDGVEYKLSRVSKDGVFKLTFYSSKSYSLYMRHYGWRKLETERTGIK